MKRTLLVLALLSACGGGGDDDDMIDAAPPSPDAASPDANPNCEPTAALPYEWRPIEEVSVGGVNLTTNGANITSGTIDATAGGAFAAGENPYIYVDLQNNVKVDITDVDSYTQSTWDIALKRFSIRVNGGDSGPGGVEVALRAGSNLGDVTMVPAASEFTTDDWADATCDLRPGQRGEPETAMGTWYNYDVNTHVVTPNAYIYVLRLRDGTFRKFRIVTYYGDPVDPTRGAFYDVEWMPLL